MVLYKYGVPLNDPACFPLGYMTISSVLKNAGYDVTINNQNLYDPVPFDGFDIVMFTGFEDFLPQIAEDARVCKEKGIKTILGGALATFDPERMLDHVDTVVVGEAEDVVCDALEITGIVYGKSPDLSTVPYPDYEGFGAEEYYRRNGLRHISMLSTRGCPYSCRFCAQTCSTQIRSVDDVMKEIESHGPVDSINFVDNTFNLSKKNFLEICSRIKAPWSAAIRADRFDEEMAIAAKKSNCEWLVIGVESFRQEKLDEMNKKLKVEQIIDCLELLHKYGINYHGNILVGLPGESMEDITRELSEVPEKYNVFPVLVQPFIGTQYKTRSITKEESAFLKDVFEKVAVDREMFTYPTQ